MTRKLLHAKTKSSDASNLAFKHMSTLSERRPIKLSIETTTLCNSKCVFCAYPKARRSKNVMNMDLFTKICDEYSAIGGGHLGFSPLMSDPLVDPYFLDRIRLVRDTFHNISMDVFTNGIALQRFSDSELQEILMSLVTLNISIGGVNRKDYEIMFGVDRFNTVRASMQRVSNIAKNHNPDLRMLLHIRTNRRSDVLESQQLNDLTDMGYTCNDVLDSFSSWGEVITQDDIPAGARLLPKNKITETSPCFMPAIYFSVLSDGRVTACNCMDAKESLIVGNVSEKSIAEIWSGEEMNRIRNSFKTRQYEQICSTCSYYTPSKTYFSNPNLLNYDPSMCFWTSLG